MSDGLDVRYSSCKPIFVFVQLLQIFVFRVCWPRCCSKTAVTISRPSSSCLTRCPPSCPRPRPLSPSPCPPPSSPPTRPRARPSPSPTTTRTSHPSQAWRRPQPHHRDSARITTTGQMSTVHLIYTDQSHHQAQLRPPKFPLHRLPVPPLPSVPLLPPLPPELQPRPESRLRAGEVTQPRPRPPGLPCVTNCHGEE